MAAPRSSPRAIIHADMDAFYASVEIRDDPSLAGRAVIVGGYPAGRGVVSAASYEARRFGVHSAMPLRTAQRLCPRGVFVPGRPDRYREVSDQVMRVFASFTPLVEPISLDEAFLDVTGSAAAFGDGPTIGHRIKERVSDEIGLVVSVGVASNKLCAKVASDLRKPDALVVVPVGEEADFLAPLPIRRLWGVGPKVSDALRDFGVTTIGQLAAMPPTTLARRFGQHGAALAERARGIDSAPVVPGSAPKTIGHEHTFEHDVLADSVLETTLLDLADSVAGRLRRNHLAARGVQLKLRYEGFDTLTRQLMLPRATREARPLYDAALRLLRGVRTGGRGVRLIGITGIHLTDAEQLTLFDAAADREARLEETVDLVRARFGDGSITRARLLRDRPQRRFDFGERPAAPPSDEGLDE